MISDKSPNNVNSICKCCGITFLVILLPVLYFCGVYILYGLIIATHSGYNLETGCPNNQIACDHYEKMACRQDDMTICYIFGIFVIIAVIIAIIIIIVIILSIVNAISDCYKAYKSAVELLIRDGYISDHDVEMAINELQTSNEAAYNEMSDNNEPNQQMLEKLNESDSNENMDKLENLTFGSVYIHPYKPCNESVDSAKPC